MEISLVKNSAKDLLMSLSNRVTANDKTYLFMPYVFEIVNQDEGDISVNVHSILSLPGDFKQASNGLTEEQLFGSIKTAIYERP